MSSSSYNPLHSIKLSSIIDSIPDWDKPEGAQTNTEGGSSDVGKNLKAIVDKSSAFFNPPSWLTTTPTNDSKPLSQFPPEDDSSSTKKAINKAPAWIDSTEASKQVSKQTYKSDTDTEKNDNNNKPIIDVDLSDIPEEVQEKMRKYHLVLRGSYMAISTLMFIAAVQSMIFQFDVGLIFMALYTMVFSCMLCCFELALTPISKILAINFGFMYSRVGRFNFIIIMGFMAFSVSLFGKVCMGLLFAVMLFHMYLFYCFPRFEEYIRKTHYYEGRQARKALTRKEDPEY